jgi:hypothetical protein
MSFLSSSTPYVRVSREHSAEKYFADNMKVSQGEADKEIEQGELSAPLAPQRT